ncbi:MAG: hypothetical protein NC938_00005, partial [Candidatus Omnitrophica bacterium]|nr:hypothetical protein [Candidatus Omnitrophota bacterium]
ESTAEKLLPSPRDKEQSYKFAPGYLMNQQEKHEDIIKQRQATDDLQWAVDQDLRKKTRGEGEDDEWKLQRKRGGGQERGGGEGAIQYTLSNFDENGKPGQLNVYEYNSDRSLRAIVSYDIADMDPAKWLAGTTELKTEDGSKLLGSYASKADISTLGDRDILTMTFYIGSKGFEVADYALSGYDEELEAFTELTMYEYGGGGVLAKTVMYDVSGITEKLEPENKGAWKDLLVPTLVKRATVFEGEKSKERIRYVLDNYFISGEGANNPSRISIYDYSKVSGDQLDEVRTYDISSMRETVPVMLPGGVQLPAVPVSEEDLLAEDRDRLRAVAVYQGEKNKEKVNYSLRFGESGVQLSRSDYIYDEDESGDLDMVVTYRGETEEIISRQMYTGREGKEKVERAISYRTNGEITSISKYVYDLPASEFGGDASAKTLDRVITFRSGEDTDDAEVFLEDGYISKISYYEGRVSEENLTHVFSLNRDGYPIERSDYIYDIDRNKGLDQTRTYQLDEGDEYDLAKGKLRSVSDYSGLTGEEKIRHTQTYRLNEDGALEEDDYTCYIYQNGVLVQHETYYDNASSARLKQLAVYRGTESEERLASTTDMYRSGGVKAYSEYSYTGRSLRAVDTWDGIDKKGLRSHSVFDGFEGEEKIRSTQAYHKNDAGAIEPNDYTVYNYVNAVMTSHTVYYGEGVSGQVKQYAAYTGAEGEERLHTTIDYRRDGSIRSNSLHTYNAVTGALVSVAVWDGLQQINILSESTFFGFKGEEKTLFTQTYRLNEAGIVEPKDYTIYKYENGRLASHSTYYGNEASTQVKQRAFYQNEEGEEKLKTTTDYYRSGAVRSYSEFDYDANNTLACVSTWTDETKAVLKSVSAFFGFEGDENILNTQTYVLTSNGSVVANDYTVYRYEKSVLASHLTVYGDSSSTALKQEATYTGHEGSEKISTTTDYFRPSSGTASLTDGFARGGVKSYSEYRYDTVSKALRGVSTWEDSAKSVLLNESMYAGFDGEEKVQTSQSYYRDHTPKEFTRYIYVNGVIRAHISYYGNGSSGAVRQTATYTGEEGEEVIDNTTDYEYPFDEGEQEGEEEAVAGQAPEDESSYSEYTYDPVSGAMTMMTTWYDSSKVRLKSVSTFSGNRGGEKIQSTQTYNTDGSFKDYTVYAYDGPALVSHATYYGGPSSVIVKQAAIYTGTEGSEKIWKTTDYRRDGTISSYSEYTYDNRALERIDTWGERG